MTIHTTPEQDRQPPTALRKGGIGATGMVLMILAAMAPLTAIASNFAVSIAIGAGEGTLGLLFIVAAVFAVFTAGYVVISKQVVSAGAFFEFIAFGFGRAIGSGAAFVAAIMYTLGAAAIALVTGYFARNAFLAHSGIDLPWWAYALATLAVAGVLGHFGIAFATRLTSITSVLQLAILVAFCVAVVIQNPSGYSLHGFTPHAMFDGNYSLALVIIVLCFNGYESASVFGEESKTGSSAVKRATYTSLALIVVVFGASAWSVLAAFDDPIAAAQANPSGFIFAATDQYLGSWSGPLLNFLVAFSFFSATISFTCMAHRYVFALGRARLISPATAKVHAKHGTPFVANWVQIALAVALIVLFAVQNSDPFVGIMPAIAGVTGVSLLALLAACSASVVVAARKGLLSGSTWSVLVAPTVSAIAWLVFIALYFQNYSAVTGSSSPWIKAVMVIPLFGFVYGYLAHRRLAAAGKAVIPSVV